MLLIKNTVEYPRYIGDLINEYPDWQEPDSLPDGWEAVVATEAPQVSAGYRVKEIFPVLIDGIWHQAWEEEEISQEEADAMAKQEEERLTKYPGFNSDTV